MTMQLPSMICCANKGLARGVLAVLAAAFGLALTSCQSEVSGGKEYVAFVPSTADVAVIKSRPRLTVPTTERERALALADELQYRHQFAAAKSELTRWLLRNPRDSQALLSRAQINIALREPRAALADCLQAAHGLSALTATACQAQALGAVGEVATARTLLARVLPAVAPQSSSEDSWALSIAAELAAQAGAHDIAERYYRDAVRTANGSHYPAVAYAKYLQERRRAVEQ
jgi:tetratricopeptide (TPR) repeat protein